MQMYFKKIDWFLAGAVIVLCALGMLELWGIEAGAKSSLPAGGAGNFFIKQLIFFSLGLALMFLISLIDGRMFRNSSLLLTFYFICAVLLALVLVLGHKTRGMIGAFKLGELNFAPVEVAKLVLIFVLAKYFSGRHVEVYRVRHIIASGLYMLLPVGFVLLQPDLGSAIILMAVWLGIVLLSGMKQRHLMIVLATGAIVCALAWVFALKPYQKERILTIINPNRDPLGYSYNVIQSKIAIGSGAFLGKGLGQGLQGQLNFLPEKHTDFIFALFAEEWGFLGVLFLFAAYGVLFWRLFRLILLSGNNFFRLFIAGYAVMTFTHLLINVGMNLGVMPVTGISLPFLSYGGNNLLMNFIALGIIQNIATQTSGSVRFNEE